jgi:hypothetical protein
MLYKYQGHSESKFWLAVNKTSNEKKIFIMVYTKYIYIHKLLLNVVTAGIEAFVISRNKFLYACVKEDSRLWAQPHFVTFHQLLIIIEVLWSQRVLQVG